MTNNKALKELCYKWFCYGNASTADNEDQLKYIFEADWFEKKSDPSHIRLLREIISDCSTEWLEEKEEKRKFTVALMRNNIKKKEDRRDQFVGIRFSIKEKEIIDNFIKNKGYKLAEFIREAVLSHINNLEENYANLEMNKITPNIEKIKTAIKEINNSIIIIDKELSLSPFEQFEVAAGLAMIEKVKKEKRVTD